MDIGANYTDDMFRVVEQFSNIVYIIHGTRLRSELTGEERRRGAVTQYLLRNKKYREYLIKLGADIVRRANLAAKAVNPNSAVEVPQVPVLSGDEDRKDEEVAAVVRYAHEFVCDWYICWNSADNA